MRNVTITLDDDTAKWVRIEAAKADTSVSRWIGQLLDQQRRHTAEYDSARDSYVSRQIQPLKSNDARYPTRDDVHQR